MWSYYGTKKLIADKYPKPKHKIVREYFAGAAGYSMLHFEHDIELYDKFDVIVKVWKFLQKCSPEDIKRLPKLEAGDKITRNMFSCDEEMWLCGFLINAATVSPGVTMTDFAEKGYEPQKKYIANNLFKIKHWKIEQKEYQLVEDIKCTHFLDPPYQFGGEHYVKGSKDIHFGKLAEFCKSRTGQVIVCENMKATWLPFVPLVKMNGMREVTTEGIWTNYHTALNNEQLSMF